MTKKKSKKEKSDYGKLNDLFNKIENLPEFKEWFGKPCPDFEPLCANCQFWNNWNKFKIYIYTKLL
jgi:hypothetical protein